MVMHSQIQAGELEAFSFISLFSLTPRCTFKLSEVNKRQSRSDGGGEREGSSNGCVHGAEVKGTDKQEKGSSNEGKE